MNWIFQNWDGILGVLNAVGLLVVNSKTKKGG